MPVREVLKLGNPSLYRVSVPMERDDTDPLQPLVHDLHDTLIAFRARYGAGRAIAAPQIGVMKRLVYMHITAPVALINPVIEPLDEERVPVWDDCMCFPDLLVRVLRHRRCSITYRDLTWQEQAQILEGDLAELLQHEVDHLDGVLAVSLAIDGRSFALRSQRHHLSLETSGREYET